MQLAPRTEPLLRTDHSGWPVYDIFGLNLASEHPFANRIRPGLGVPELTFSCVDQPPRADDWEHEEPPYASPSRTEDGKRVAALHRLDTCDVLRFTGVADFYLWRNRVVCHLLDPAHDYLVEILLLGPVLSYWLELRGVPALHASAVEAGRSAVAFLSSNRGGKSTLAATLMQAGLPLLTDDILPVERTGEVYLGRPGYPTMRMWPEEAEHFVGSCQDLDLVHPDLTKCRVPVGPDGFGAFCDGARPLACIYLPTRRDPEDPRTHVEITPVSPKEAVIELVRHSFTPRVVEAVGLQPQRLRVFAELAQEVSVRRLFYPGGFDQLPGVRQAILKDLSRLHALS